MAWTDKEKELFAVGTSVAAGCKPCTDYHFKAVRTAGASDEEINHVIADATRVRMSASQNMEAYALKHLESGCDIPEPIEARENTRVSVLVCIGAAFAVNSTSDLERHLSDARAVGISEDEVYAAVKLAAFIKKMGASHVEKMVGLENRE